MIPPDRDFVNVYIINISMLDSIVRLEHWEVPVISS
jgi:hypothetical protein